MEPSKLEVKPMKTSQMAEGENDAYWFKYFEAEKEHYQQRLY